MCLTNIFFWGSGSSSYVRQGVSQEALIWGQARVLMLNRVRPNKYLFGVRLKFLCEAGCVLRNAYLGSGSSFFVRQGVS